MAEPLYIKTIHDLRQIAGVPTVEHPSFLIVRLEDIPKLPNNYPDQLMYGFYSIGLKRNLNGYVKYGRRQYDFQEGVMSYTAPNQVIGFNSDIINGASGWLLFFHLEFLAGSSLAKDIQHHRFFDYQVNEALHLSRQEEDLLESLMQGLNIEYQKPIDQHSKSIMISHLELLFTYTDRFYTRQFITRDQVDSSFLDKFQQEVRRYFAEESLIDKGLPSVGYFAEHMHVSQNYLADLLKDLTGKTTLEHIHLHLIEKAKNELLTDGQSITQIAYSLGFEHPPYFTRLFKEKTGQTPTEFRMAN